MRAQRAAGIAGGVVLMLLGAAFALFFGFIVLLVLMSTSWGIRR